MTEKPSSAQQKSWWIRTTLSLNTGVCHNYDQSGTNLNHEHVGRRWVDFGCVVLLAHVQLLAQAGTAKVIGPFQGAQRVEVSQDG